MNIVLHGVPYLGCGDPVSLIRAGDKARIGASVMHAVACIKALRLIERWEATGNGR